MARVAVDAWMLHADDLDPAMDALRDYVKGKPAAISEARRLLTGETE